MKSKTIKDFKEETNTKKFLFEKPKFTKGSLNQMQEAIRDLYEKVAYLMEELEKVQ